jgi:hypothetical protein
MAALRHSINFMPITIVLITIFTPLGISHDVNFFLSKRLASPTRGKGGGDSHHDNVTRLRSQNVPLFHRMFALLLVLNTLCTTSLTLFALSL